jgi:uncharacterized integral membrane protein
MRRRCWPVVIRAYAAVVAVALALGTAPAYAHVEGEGSEFAHVIVEVGVWTLGIGAVLAALVGIFWLRARAMRRRQP